MAIFPDLIKEDLVQVNDKTRLNATKSYAGKDEAAVSLVRIDPGDGTGFVDVTGSSSKDWYLDWEYSTDGDKTVQVEITTDGAPTTSSYTLSVISVADDNLFSSDEDLVAEEPKIMSWVPDGRSSYLNVHRQVQRKILDFLNRNAHWNTDGTAFDKSQVVDLTEVREWSKFWVLATLFEGNSNSVDDIFGQKALRYHGMKESAQRRAALRLDLDKDGTIDDMGEKIGFNSLNAVRR